MILAILALIAAGLIAVIMPRRGPSPVAEKGRVVLLLLPFENLNGEPDQEYFSDGLTEDTITQLGALDPQRLGVIARTSAMRYRGSKKPVREIGGEVNADYVLEGTVRRGHGILRITAHLVRVADDTHLWAQAMSALPRTCSLPKPR